MLDNVHSLKSIRCKIVAGAVAALVCLSFSSMAHAVEGPGFYPAISVRTVMDDNIYRNKEEKHDDTYSSVAPTLSFLGMYGKHAINIIYKGDYGFYNEYSTENYLDHDGSADLYLKPSEKLQFKLNANYQDTHEIRGFSGSRTDIGEDPDFVNQQSAKMELTYGRKTNILQFKGSFEALNRKYTNNGQEARSRDIITGAGVVYYNIGAKTAVTLTARNLNIDYTRPVVDLDSVETHFLAGVAWEATAKTTGEIRLGYIAKDLKDETLDDFAGFGAEAEIRWEPKTFTQLGLMVVRTTQETSHLGASFFVDNRVVASLRHEFNSRIAAKVLAEYQNNVFSQDRTDNMGIGHMEAEYKLSKRFSLFGRYTHVNRSSNFIHLDYTVNIFFLAISASAL